MLVEDQSCGGYADSIFVVTDSCFWENLHTEAQILILQVKTVFSLSLVGMEEWPSVALSGLTLKMMSNGGIFPASSSLG